MGACNSTRSRFRAREEDTSRHVTYSFHENLVRQRTGRHRFDQIYEVLEEIGNSGLCTIYRLRRRQISTGGGSSTKKLAARRNSWNRLKSGRFNHRQQPASSPPKREEPVAEGSANSNNNKEIFFALKVIHLSLVQEDKIDQLTSEVEFLKTLDHKNIIKAYETFSFPHTKTLEIVMELCTGGDLHARMPYTEASAANALKQILSAISYVHDREIIHRDIKFENIMYESKHPEACIKVIDFGLSKQYSMDNPVLTERVGTLYSMSPETMQGHYTTKSDLWSIGVVLFMMLSNGDKPFEGKTPKQLVARVLIGDVRFDGPLWKDISTEAQEFIKTLLRVDPEDRVTAHEAMKDPWFTPSPITTSQSPKCKRDLIEKVQESIVKFADTGEFRKLALNVIAKKSTSEEIFELRKVFDEFDTLNSGTITLVEFKQALVRFNYSDEEIEKIFRKVDVNQTNVINYTEFLAATLETQGTIEEHRLSECFEEFDTDESGYISRDNLRVLLGKHSSEAFIDVLMQEAEATKDGRITYEQFRRVVSRRNRRTLSKLYDESGQNLPVVSEDAIADDNGSIAEDEVLQRFGIIDKMHRSFNNLSTKISKESR
ncbi:MAP kinase-activated protein kinase 2 (Fragment) [Seminavis robusta]|uniref:MAP kinase-activated protein kinase 2 n=1 Tax=Seminavis robusta TaxID=568900 RepID=A0A9N8HCK6_9STRA